MPEIYELDDFEVKTSTDIIGQHIHLPKWDLTTTDGSGNGWNYEDGTLSPGTVRERIDAINAFNLYLKKNNREPVPQRRREQPGLSFEASDRTKEADRGPAALQK